MYAAVKDIVTSRYLMVEAGQKIVLLCIWLACRQMTPFGAFLASTDWSSYSHSFISTPIIPGPLLFSSLVFVTGLAGGVCLAVLFVQKRSSPVDLLYWAFGFALAVARSVLTAGVVTNVLKLVSGRPRPDAINRCFPSLYSAGHLVPSTLSRHRTMAPHMCEASKSMSAKIVRDTFKSFPSGHAAYFAAVCTVGCFAYAVTVSRKPGTTKFTLPTTLHLAVLLGLGVLLPVMVAISRVTDHRHHISDVVFGLAVGYLAGWKCFYSYFQEDGKPVWSSEKTVYAPEAQ